MVLVTFYPNIARNVVPGLGTFVFYRSLQSLVRYFGIYSWSCFSDKRVLRLWIM